MKIKCTAFLILFAIAPIPQAQTLDDFLRYPEYQTVKISPDGKHLALRKLENGRHVLAFMSINPLEVTTILRFARTNEIGDYYWVNNDRVITEIWTRHGWFDSPSNYGLLYGINYDGTHSEPIFGYLAGEMQTGTRIKRRDSDRAHAKIVDLLRDDPQHILIDTLPWGVRGTFEVYGAVYRLDVYTGVQKKVVNHPQARARVYTDNNSEVRLATATDTDNFLQLYLKNKGLGWTKIEQESDETFASEPVGFSNDNSIAYLVSYETNRLKGLYQLDLDTFERRLVFRSEQVDISSADILHTPNLRSVIGVYSEPNYPSFLCSGTESNRWRETDASPGVDYPHRTG
jgi:hypothetical protein